MENKQHKMTKQENGTIRNESRRKTCCELTVHNFRRNSCHKQLQGGFYADVHLRYNSDIMTWHRIKKNEDMDAAFPLESKQRAYSYNMT